MVNTKERPIALTAQEVNAVLAGDKTQHRMPFDFEFIKDVNVPIVQKVADETNCTLSELVTGAYNDSVYDFICPFGKVGDRLWVRETHHVPDFLHDYEQDELARGLITRDSLGMSYKADAPHMTPADGGWTSPVAMPRWASRLLLEITDIRIERIQDISESDALASGLIVQACQQGSQWFLNPASRMKTNVFHRDEWHSAFSVYWDSLHGVGAWDRNDWVWVYDLKKANN